MPTCLPTFSAVEKIACLEIDLPPKMKATKVVWGALNEKLIVSYADGTIRTFDTYDGTELEYAQVGQGASRIAGLAGTTAPDPPFRHFSG